ncbi:MAG: DUF4158 domain-containing protein [Pirellulaceae bacterium]
MKRQWGEAELSDQWSLSHDEFELLRNRSAKGRLAFAAMLKFFQHEGRFPQGAHEVPKVALLYLAEQIGVGAESLYTYDFNGRTAKRDRKSIRRRLGFHRITSDESKALTAWLRTNVFPVDHKPEHVHESVSTWCRTRKIEPPTPPHLQRVLGAALSRFENDFFSFTFESLPSAVRVAMDELVLSSDEGDSENVTTPFAEMSVDSGRPSLDSVLGEVAKLSRINHSRSAP